MSEKCIAYLLWEFPSYTETFILKEIRFINTTFPLYVLALKRGRSTVDKNQFGELVNNLIYLPSLFSINSILYHLIILRRSSYLKQMWKKLLLNIFCSSIKKNLFQIKVLLAGTYVIKIINEKSIKHVHAHFANFPTDVAMLAAQLSGISFSFSAHANDIYVKPQDLLKKIHKSAFVVTCTKYNKNWLDSIVPISERDKIHLVYHGVDCRYWYNNLQTVIRNKKSILFIGRLVEKKGVIYLLKAFVQIIKSDPTIQLIIIGKGKKEWYFKRFCIQNQINNSVTFLGWQNPRQIKQLFAHSDIIVLPSIISSDGDRDGIPNVLLEAMAFGLPVISTPVSGIIELIKHRDTGILVPERDSNQLVMEIITLLKDHELRNKIIKNAMNFVKEKFNSEECNHLLKFLFENIK